MEPSFKAGSQVKLREKCRHTAKYHGLTEEMFSMQGTIQTIHHLNGQIVYFEGCYWSWSILDCLDPDSSLNNNIHEVIKFDIENLGEV